MANHEFNPNKKLLPWAAKAFSQFSKFYHRYEIKGLENIPQEGGALLVFYHGLVPLDFWYFGLRLQSEIGRHPCALVDRWMLKTPGLSWFTKSVGGIEGNHASALKVLREGHLVGVSPGGVREAISGRKNNYRLIWGQRKGFAKLALEAGVPIIPAFTENVEGMYHAPFAGSAFFQNLYEKTRLPIVPVVGLGPLPFPVKLTTWLGEPILPSQVKLELETSAPTSEAQVVDAIVLRTRAAIEDLIQNHQVSGKPNPVLRLKGKTE